MAWVEDSERIKEKTTRTKKPNGDDWKTQVLKVWTEKLMEKIKENDQCSTSINNNRKDYLSGCI